MSSLLEHLKSGVTTTCRCWALTRRDGVVMGFTDHDRLLAFEGVAFRPDTGLSALALQQTTGLSVDNTEALGALSDAAIREADIEAGRYDGAELRAWLVNWQDLTARKLIFRGTMGELRRAGGAFEAELRGLTDALNVPLGRVYQKACSAILGDRSCTFDLDTPGYVAERPAETVDDNRVFRFAEMRGFEDDWFRHGVIRVLSGAAVGLIGLIKRDRSDGAGRVIDLWHPFGATVAPGDALRIEAGCDKRRTTCQFKFDNLLNYQGFPDIPGDDWTITDPTKSPRLDGGSRR
ncbi:putative phage protein (TIGR02218 family) [Roseovarius sp. MBR-51]